MGYARIRPELAMSWSEAGLRDLEGNFLYWIPKTEWVKTICFDGMESGLYVLTEDDDSYFTAHSIDLEFEEEIPTRQEKTMGKHAGRYDRLKDIAESKEEAVVALGQELDTWQLIARDLARDIVRSEPGFDSVDFAKDVIRRLAVMPEMNIHPVELNR
tara:strand:- start:811 stop:1284 length:474 start_codon:yes stop_codon:yes gene_type:complete